MTSPLQEQPRGDSLVIGGYDLPSFRYVAGGYNKIVECDRAGMRMVVQDAIEYAREHGLPLQVYSRHVRADIEAGFIDASGIDVQYMVGGPS